MIIYLHGLNSAGTSAKAARIREGLAPIPVYSPTYPAQRPADAIDYLSEYIRARAAGAEFALVGSSMGGFYGQYLARRFKVRHLYLINPALRPWELLPGLDAEQCNQVTGERYRLLRDDVEATRDYALGDVCDGVETTLLMDKGDELIDYRIADAIYARCGRKCLFEGGNHRFEHVPEALALIRRDFGLEP